MQPRDYQLRAVEGCRAAYRRGTRAVLLVVPTGGGKTVIGSLVVEGALARGRRVLWLAGRRELVVQAAARLPGRVGVVMAGRPRDLDAPVQVASLDTVVGQDIAPVDLALEVAEEAGLMLMAHLDHSPPSRAEVLSRLRPGDILTHCFRPFPNAPSKPGGGVREEVLAARERGVIFDIGHGGGSLGFGTARAMLDAGFLPDVISSDVHVISIDGPAFDLLHTLAKFHALGMELPDLVACATVNAARAIRRPDLGTLKPGVGADASIFRILDEPTVYHDVEGVALQGAHRWVAGGLVLSGQWWTDPN